MRKALGACFLLTAATIMCAMSMIGLGVEKGLIVFGILALALTAVVLGTIGIRLIVD